MIGRRFAPVAALSLSLSGCVPEPPRTALAPTSSTWRHALDRLATIRRRAAAARTDRIALTLVEPRSRRRLEARGAVALAPPRALRMILLGPGGTTALDLWLAGDRYRFAVPAIDLIKVGDITAPPAARRGLPVDFLAYWLLRPAEGSLLWYAREPAADRFVLRSGPAIVDLRAFDDGHIVARRTTWADRERLDDETVVADRIGCGVVRYHQRATGLDVTVRCEGETLGEPPARALADPDAGGSP